MKGLDPVFIEQNLKQQGNLLMYWIGWDAPTISNKPRSGSKIKVLTLVTVTDQCQMRNAGESLCICFKSKSGEFFKTVTYNETSNVLYCLYIYIHVNYMYV